MHQRLKEQYSNGLVAVNLGTVIQCMWRKQLNCMKNMQHYLFHLNLLLSFHLCLISYEELCILD